MFKSKWWMGSRVVSDEGFETAWGRDTLLYKENSRTMSITIDYGANEIVIFAETVNRWDDEPLQCIADEEQNRIIENISIALAFYGELHPLKVTIRD